MLFLSQSAYGQTKAATGPPGGKTIDEPGIAKKVKPALPSNWSSFISYFKGRRFNVPKIQFEVGLTSYYAAFNSWSFLRIEPFIKVRYALLDKYIQIYSMIALDAPSAMSYKLSQAKILGNDIEMKVKLSALGNTSFGGGIEFYIFGWKKLDFFAYVQLQTASMNEATLDQATLSINKKNLDILEQVRPYITISYNFQRYDCGHILSYQATRWFSASFRFGYIWLRARFNITLEQELIDAIAKVAGAYNKDLIPKKLELDAASPFALLNLRFRLHKKFDLALEGMVIPSSKPIYDAQVSFIIHGDN